MITLSFDLEPVIFQSNKAASLIFPLDISRAVERRRQVSKAGHFAMELTFPIKSNYLLYNDEMETNEAAD